MRGALSPVMAYEMDDATSAIASPVVFWSQDVLGHLASPVSFDRLPNQALFINS